MINRPASTIKHKDIIKSNLERQTQIHKNMDEVMKKMEEGVVDKEILVAMMDICNVIDRKIYNIEAYH